jgi:hypothetical protein
MHPHLLERDRTNQVEVETGVFPFQRHVDKFVDQLNVYLSVPVTHNVHTLSNVRA